MAPRFSRIKAPGLVGFMGSVGLDKKSHIGSFVLCTEIFEATNI